MKKRILQFIGSFNQGGSERQAVSMTRLLKNEGSFEVFAATLNNEGVLRPGMESLGLPAIPEFPLTSFYNTNFVRQVRLCAKYLTENQIDLVHTHDFYTNVFGMAAATIAGIPVRIASKRETGGMRSRGQEFVEKAAFNRADAIIANSKAVRTHLARRGFNGSKVRLIYNGIGVESFAYAKIDRASASAKLGLPFENEAQFITMVANLRHGVKNVPMLLRAAKRVIEVQPHVHFVIAGEGELEKELRTQAEMLGVGKNVHFIGRCTGVPALLVASYACVLTSRAEGFSNSILEYMAAGKTVVATNVGGAAEAVVDGVNGYLVESDDDAAMARRLIELLENEEKTSAFGAKGREYVAAEFSAETQLSKTIELYDSLLNSR